MEKIREIMEKIGEYGEAVLVYERNERIGTEEIVHNYELLQQFKNTTLWLIQVYTEYNSDDGDEYCINKIYRDENGNLWLQRTLVNEDVLQIYRIY